MYQIIQFQPHLICLLQKIPETTKKRRRASTKRVSYNEQTLFKTLDDAIGGKKPKTTKMNKKSLNDTNIKNPLKAMKNPISKKSSVKKTLEKETKDKKSVEAKGNNPPLKHMPLRPRKSEISKKPSPKSLRNKKIFKKEAESSESEFELDENYEESEDEDAG